MITIFKHDCNLDFASKRYINRYLPYLLFEGIHIHYEIKRDVIDNDGEKVRLSFISLRDVTKFPTDLLRRKHGKRPTKTSKSYIQIEIIQIQKEHYRMYQILI